ncbi:Winged helix-turn-helix DNA-binding domain [Cinara cedri]|uniref:Winged helix-turn-helix DNA-binding domain n=1 Tax=Cinara cedri TaxID=506608 RepID=A0A5E4MW60_9HEMI|nr:Winged helix-turn-helix DNA-binding domain [Cinara cedri]
MDEFGWINSNNEHSLLFNSQKQPLKNENGDLLVWDSKTEECISVPNLEGILNIFGYGKRATSSDKYAPSSSKDSSDLNTEPIEVITDTTKLLWTTRTSSKEDMEATKEMLALVSSKKYQNMFNDKCTIKIQIWKRIYKELLSKGYLIAESTKEGSIKCHQKWRNLEKSYRNFLISLTDPTNLIARKPPPFFDEMHKILKRKKKYANATETTYTVVTSEHDLETEEEGSTHDNDSTTMDVQNLHQLNDSDQLEEDVDKTKDRKVCYLAVNSKNLETLTKASSRTRVFCPVSNGTSSSSTTSATTTNHVQSRPQNPPNTLELILKQMVRLHEDTLVMEQQHFDRVENLMRCNITQTRRLANVMHQLLYNIHTDEDSDSG